MMFTFDWDFGVFTSWFWDFKVGCKKMRKTRTLKELKEQYGKDLKVLKSIKIKRFGN